MGEEGEAGASSGSGGLSLLGNKDFAGKQAQQRYISATSGRGGTRWHVTLSGQDCTRSVSKKQAGDGASQAHKSPPEAMRSRSRRLSHGYRGFGKQ